MAMFHDDRTNMPCIDWINHVVLDSGCARLGFCMEMEWVSLNIAC